MNVFALYRARTTSLEPRWLGGEVWGRFDEGAWSPPATSAPTWCRCRRRGRRRRVRRARAHPEPHRLHDRRPAPTRSRSFWNGVAALGPAARDAVGAAAPGDRGPPAVEPRSRRAPHHAGRPRPALPGVRRDVHRGGRRLTGGRRRRRAVPRPGQQLVSAAGRSPASRATGWCSRPRWRAPPYAAQIQGVWVPPDRRGEGIAVAGMAAVVELVRARSHRWCRSTSTTGTSPARRPTSGSASRRRRGSRP